MKNRVYNFLPIFVLVSIFLITFVIDVPTATRLPLCFLKAMSGIDCPGCGLLRSLISLSHGHWRASLHFHLLGPFVYLLLFAYLVSFLLKIFSKKIEVQWLDRQKKVISTCFVVLLLGQWVVRVVEQVYLKWFS